MKSRVFNRTGRRRILHTASPIVFDDRNRTLEVLPFTDVSSWLPKIPDEDQQDAEVFIDIECTLLHVREHLGKLKDVVHTAWCGQEIPLPDRIPNSTTIHIEIKVVSKASLDRPGVILARAEPRRFQIGSRGPTQSLLTVQPEDLGDEIWQLRFSADYGPELVINDRITDYQAAVRSDWFRTTVLQAVIPSVYERIAARDGEETWMEGWCNHQSCRDASPRPRRSASDNPVEFHDECHDWAREVTQLMAKRISPEGSRSLRRVFEDSIIDGEAQL